MANLKQRLRRKNSDGSYDIIYLQADMTNVTGTLPIAHGGTGATSASGALSNIGAAASSHTHSEYAAASHGHAATEITCNNGATAQDHIDSLWGSLAVRNVYVAGFDAANSALHLGSL